MLGQNYITHHSCHRFYHKEKEMTKAQQLRNIKGGLQPKAIVYQPLTENNDRRVPASLTELLQAVYRKQNLKQGGLKTCHVKGS